ncbi:hypothetical protein KIN20_025219 [Parelaphostrongylus tenuis]|uniref:Uncharacterized protein n=1 Tax=Parelaphostrongylus tenuis TaxID=148309 RepID=A0AAD5MZ87_PARTN|nr:hypothetical protein KIN20_025219 [Parelaphostrongylus tenuis]
MSLLFLSSTRDQTTASFAQRSVFSRKGEKSAKPKQQSPATAIRNVFKSLAGSWKDTVVDNINEEQKAARGDDNITRLNAQQSR